MVVGKSECERRRERKKRQRCHGEAGESRIKYQKRERVDRHRENERANEASKQQAGKQAAAAAVRRAVQTRSPATLASEARRERKPAMLLSLYCT